MSTPKVIQYLKLKTQIRTLASLRLLSCMSLSLKNQTCVNTRQVGFLSRRYLSNRDKAEAYTTTNEDDYFGAEHHFTIIEKEHAIKKEAWLKSLENPDLKKGIEAKASKAESSKEAEQYESDIVKGLVKSWKMRGQPQENLVMRNYGWVRYDKETPSEIKELSHRIKKSEEKGKTIEKNDLLNYKDESEMDEAERNRLTNRFTSASGRSLRQSLRKTNQQYDMQKMVSQVGGLNRNRHAKLQQNLEEGNETGLSYIEVQYFQPDGADEQLYTVSKSVVQTNWSEKSHKTLLRKDKDAGVINGDSLIDKTDTDSGKESDLSYIDQQYFSRETDRSDEYSVDIKLESGPNSDRTIKFQFDDVEKQARLMGRPKKDVSATKKMKTMNAGKAAQSNISEDHFESHFGSEYIDEQYFGYKPDSDHQKDMEGSRDSEKETVRKQKPSVDVDSKKDKRPVKREKKETVNKLSIEVDKSNTGALKLYEERPRSNLTKEKPKVKETKKPETAEEAAMRKRAELEEEGGMRLFGRINAKKLDQKGFRILSGQVPDFTDVPAMEIAGVLRNNIVYNNNDIVAINKPYGLSSRRGQGSRVSVEQLVDDLIPQTRLHLISGIGKDTTGVLLLAKTHEMAEKLEDALKKEDTMKRYLVVTKNVPKLLRGEINIPIGDGITDGKVRKKLKPYGDSDMGISSRVSKNAERAVTRYEVLSRQESWALIECWPLTNVKHQVRVHLAFGLNCPILGDHKYSHFDKIAPMKLHSDMLDKLKVRQSKVRDIALHIHGRAVIIPGFLGGRNLIITAPLPPHFIKNMKSLSLNMPPGKYY